MSDVIDEFKKGRKTFFIAPDKSLLPEAFLEEYLSRDYECYFVEFDRLEKIQNKIETILKTFNDAIIFFNVDCQIQNLKWDIYIRQLVNRFPEAKFGITYAKRQSPVVKIALEQLYLYHIGLQCGCIQLEYQKRNNFGIIEKTLYANQAMGRRKNVRAVCPSGCGFDLITQNQSKLSGVINDISVSHFTCLCQEDDEKLSNFSKFPNINIKIKGLQFRSDAVLCMKRSTHDGILYVFAFTNKNGQNGLDLLNRQLLIPKMYEIMTENFKTVLQKQVS